MKKWMLLLLAGLGVALAGFYFAGGLFVGPVSYTHLTLPTKLEV